MTKHIHLWVLKHQLRCTFPFFLPAGKQIVLRPAHLHFGSIPVGAVVHRSARLLNGSADVVRFTILRPELPLRCGLWWGYLRSVIADTVACTPVCESQLRLAICLFVVMLRPQGAAQARAAAAWHGGRIHSGAGG